MDSPLQTVPAAGVLNMASNSLLLAARYRLRLLAFRPSAVLTLKRNPVLVFLPHRHLCAPAAPSRAAPRTARSARATTAPPPSSLPTPPSVASHPGLVAAIKAKVASNAPRKALELLTDAHQGRIAAPLDADAYRATARALIRANRADLALAAYRLREEAGLSADPALSAAVARACLRLASSSGSGQRREARREVAQGAQEALTGLLAATEKALQAEELQAPTAFVTALCSVQVAFLKAGDPDTALEAARVMKGFAKLGSRAATQVGDYNEIIRWYGKTRRMEGVFATMDAMRAAGVTPSTETFEFLANAAVRSVEFVTGAVSMKTLPEPLAAEVAFCGRSNVGKSSLVNMMVNRKALARVSGTPGKTQQFNYFIVNEASEQSKYYLVDLPGVGYAKVPKSIREPWVGFMKAYFGGRQSLQVVFHLVDGRHGPLADDDALMRMIVESGFKGEYVVVLTKMDKMDKQKVKSAVLQKVKKALHRNGCPSHTPIVVTSSSTRLGRDEMWRHMQRALKDTVPVL